MLPCICRPSRSMISGMLSLYCEHIYIAADCSRKEGKKKLKRTQSGKFAFHPINCDQMKRLKICSEVKID